MYPLLPNPYIIGRSTWWPSGFPSPCDKLELLKSAPKLVENSKILILHGTNISMVLNSMLVDLFHLMCDHYVEYANNNDGIMPFESRGGTSLKLFPLESSDNLLFTSPIVYLVTIRNCYPFEKIKIKSMMLSEVKWLSENQ